MEEELRQLVASAVEGLIPQIAYAVVERMNELPSGIKTLERAEACQILHVSRPTLDGLIKDGTIRAKRIGRRVIIPESEIENLLASGEPIKYRRAKA